LTPEGVRSAITPRTRAVIPVHLYGQMCDTKGIQAVLQHRPDIAVIEDCAHCFEGSRDGYLPGEHSTCAVFSFYATKNVTCGEGGAIVTNDPDLAGKVRQTRLHGMSQGAADRFKLGQYRHWDMSILGTKANLPDLLAALLPHQIEQIREWLPARQAIANRYRQAFANSGIGMQKILPECSSAEHVFPIHVPPSVRDEAIAVLNAREIGIAVNYRSVPTLTYYAQKYGYTPDSFPVSYHWGAGTLTLPLYQSLSADKQDWVIESVLEKVKPLCEGVSPASAR
jgi:UDP-4-amino-4-deoxy-L-arabinose-oxoglutarate aminotransferase